MKTFLRRGATWCIKISFLREAYLQCQCIMKWGIHGGSYGKRILHMLHVITKNHIPCFNWKNHVQQYILEPILFFNQPNPILARVSLTNHNVHSQLQHSWVSSWASRVVTHLHMHYMKTHKSYLTSKDDGKFIPSLSISLFRMSTSSPTLIGGGKGPCHSMLVAWYR